MMRVLVLLAALVNVVGSAIPGTGSIVHFLVFANHQSDVLAVFPGASVDYTWNNIFIVTVWTDDPPKAVARVTSVLETAPNLRVLVSPYTLEVATQEWLRYNLLWVLLLVLALVAGCVCGAVVMGDCNRYKNEMQRRYR